MKQFYSLILALCVCVVATSCGGDDGPGDEPTSVVLNSGSRTTYVVNADDTSLGGEIAFSATGAWTATVEAYGGTTTSSTYAPLASGVDWITISPASGGAGKQSIKVTLQPNTSTSLRSCRIRISGANNTIYISITQREAAAQPGTSDEGVSKTGWTLVWSDEFDGADNSQPSSDKWIRSTRYSSTWNRYISDSEDVIFIKDGKLVARAIPNPDTSVDNVPMLTGAVETRTKFSFTYGIISVKAKTNPFSGNFPAIWLMPAPPTQSWPEGGEIDIWEQINTSNIGYHTIHSKWTNTLGNTSNPTSAFQSTLDYSTYHVYELVWTEDRISWYVDGSLKGSYAKSTSQSALDQGQWPFNKPFYLILNQSVGDGSWAASPNTSHTYETTFEYARIYQK